MTPAPNGDLARNNRVAVGTRSRGRVSPDDIDRLWAEENGGAPIFTPYRYENIQTRTKYYTPAQYTGNARPQHHVIARSMVNRMPGGDARARRIQHAWRDMLHRSNLADTRRKTALLGSLATHGLPNEVRELVFDRDMQSRDRSANVWAAYRDRMPPGHPVHDQVGLAGAGYQRRGRRRSRSTKRKAAAKPKKTSRRPRPGRR